MPLVAETVLDLELTESARMAITLSDIQNHLNGLGTKHFVDDERGIILVPCRCGNNKVHIMITLGHDGAYLHLSSSDFAAVKKDAAHSAAALEEMLDINFKTTMIKMSRDADDSQVIGEADMWIEDGTVTAKQLDRMLDNFATSMFAAQVRLQAAAAPGKSARDRDLDDFLDACVSEAAATTDREDRSDGESSQAA